MIAELRASLIASEAACSNWILNSESVKSDAKFNELILIVPVDPVPAIILSAEFSPKISRLN